MRLEIDEIRKHSTKTINSSISSRYDISASRYDTSDKERVELGGRIAYFKLRGCWSGWIIFWITFSLIMQFAIVFCLGFNVMSFDTHKWFVAGIVGKNLFEIIGMGVMAAKYLFKD